MNEELLRTLENDVLGISKKCLRETTDKALYHNLLKRGISRLSINYGFHGREEYKILNYDGKGRNGFIDVVWSIGELVVFGFEIDSSCRKGSIQKLIISGIPNPLWVYYGKRDPSVKLGTFDPDEKISIIRLAGIRFRKG